MAKANKIFTAKIVDIFATHVGKYGRDGAKTTVWAAVANEGGCSCNVWIDSYPGISFKKVERQIAEAEKEHTYLIGKEVKVKRKNFRNCTMYFLA